MFSFSRRTLSCALRRLKSVQEKSGYGRQRCRSLANLSYYHQPGTEPLLSWTLGEVVDRTADAKGDNIAVVSCHQNISKTFTEYRNDINQFAAGLVSLQLPVGSKIGIVAPNLYEWAVTQFASAKAGLVLVNVNTAYQVSELEFCLNHVKCAALIVAEKFARQDFYQMLLQIMPELKRSAMGQLKSARLPLLKHVILISETSKPGTVTYDDLMQSATAEHHAAMHAISSKLQFDEVINIQFTSGTTGRPKAAQLSHFNIVNNADLIGRVLGLREQVLRLSLSVLGLLLVAGDAEIYKATLFKQINICSHRSVKWCLALEFRKFSEVFLLLRPLILFGQFYERQMPDDGNLPSTSVRRFATDHNQIIKGVGRKKPAMEAKIHLVPFANHGTKHFVHLNYPAFVNGSIVTVRLLFSSRVSVLFLFSRTSPLTKHGTVSLFRIISLDWIAAGRIRREVIMPKFQPDPIPNSKLVSDFLKISMGAHFRPFSVSGAVEPHAFENSVAGFTYGVLNFSQVVGVPDKRLGEESCAWIKLKPGKTLNEEDVKSFCKGKLSHFKIPKYVLFVEAFPKTVSGKIQKHKMRDESKKILNL
ncbi:unnamed protein product [Ixodes persulcatus]